LPIPTLRICSNRTGDAGVARQCTTILPTVSFTDTRYHLFFVFWHLAPENQAWQAAAQSWRRLLPTTSQRSNRHVRSTLLKVCCVCCCCCCCCFFFVFFCKMASALSPFPLSVHLRGPSTCKGVATWFGRIASGHNTLRFTRMYMGAGARAAHTLLDSAMWPVSSGPTCSA